MAADGDAPEGLVAQPKLGAKNTARSRRRKQETGTDDTYMGARRAKIRKRNDALWVTWLELRALERERARQRESAEIAERLEKERAEEAQQADLAIKNAADERARHDAIVDAPHLDTLNPWAQAIAWAENPTEACDDDEFERVLDQETDSAVSETEHVEIPWRMVKRAPRIRERMRGD